MSEQPRSAVVPLSAAPDKVKRPPRQKLRSLIAKLGSGSSGGRSKTSVPGVGHNSSSHRRTQTVDADLNTRELSMNVGARPGSRLSDPFSLIEIMDARSRSSPLWIPPFRRVAIPRPVEPKKKPLLPRLWQVVSNSSPSRKNKDTVTWPEYDANGHSFPLDGEEGELVEDEGCYESDIIQTAALLAIPLPTRMDVLYLLPPEISLEIVSLLDVGSVLSASQVSKYWHLLATDRYVWRALFKRQTQWRLKSISTSAPLSPAILLNAKSRLGRTSSTGSRQNIPSLASYHSSDDLVRPSCMNLSVDWATLYRTRLELDRRWMIGNPKVTRLSGHADSVYSLELSPTTILTGSRDKHINIWSLRSGKQIGTLRGHEGSVLCLKYDSRAGLLASGSSDRKILVWELASAETASQMEASGDEPLVMRPTRVLTGHTGGVLDLKMNEEYIISSSKDTTIRIYSRQTFAHLHTLVGHTGPVNALGLSRNQLVSASGDGTLIVWCLPSPLSVSSSIVQHDGVPRRLRTLTGHTRGLACVDFHGDIIVSGSSDMSIKIWSAASGKCLSTFKGHEALVRSLAYDPLLGRLVSASYDRSVKVWNVMIHRRNNGFGGDEGTDVEVKKVRNFSGYHSSHILNVKFDDSRIVSSSHDRKINIMDFATNLDVSLFL